MATTETYVVSAGKAKIKKDPNATLDYSFNWAPWLAIVTDTIASVTWVKSVGLTIVSQSFTGTSATAFISGGVLGALESLTCRITTAGGRTEDRTIFLQIVER
jgi:hypothetical protein